jgi:hypothetical protein
VDEKGGGDRCLDLKVCVAGRGGSRTFRRVGPVGCDRDGGGAGTAASWGTWTRSWMLIPAAPFVIVGF